MSNQTLIEKFIYSCSHDLRAPVASIQGLVRIAQYYPHDKEIHHCLEMIDACTHEMDKRIAKLQEYMADNLRELRTEQLKARDIILRVKEEFKNQLGVCGIELTTSVAADAEWNIDRECVQRILKQLVSNSIAFHDPLKERKKIEINVSFTSHGSVLTIYDNGKGIPEAHQGRIFDVFFKATELSIGAGMGLFLVKSLTEKLGGSISCQSELNEGTTIRISFPNQVPEMTELENAASR